MASPWTVEMREREQASRTKQVSANRLENYVFQNLERIPLDKYYIDSLIFKLNNTQLGGRWPKFSFGLFKKNYPHHY